eukprot:8744581-Pyramimonas_sp.AAC.1
MSIDGLDPGLRDSMRDGLCASRYDAAHREGAVKLHAGRRRALDLTGLRELLGHESVEEVAAATRSKLPWA